MGRFKFQVSLGAHPACLRAMVWVHRAGWKAEDCLDPSFGKFCRSHNSVCLGLQDAFKVFYECSMPQVETAPLSQHRVQIWPQKWLWSVFWLKPRLEPWAHSYVKLVHKNEHELINMDTSYDVNRVIFMGESLPRAMPHKRPLSLYIFPKSWCSVIKRLHCTRSNLAAEDICQRGISFSQTTRLSNWKTFTELCRGHNKSQWVRGGHSSPLLPAPRRLTYLITHPIMLTPKGEAKF